MKKLIRLLSLTLISLLIMVGCSEDTKVKDEKSTIHSVEKSEEVEQEEIENEETFLNFLNEIAKNSEDIDEIYITDVLDIGKDEKIKPGIYDLEVTGGSGNIFGERELFPMLFINWVAASNENDSDYPSKIRIILFEGDELELDNISKIRLHAIAENVEPSNELGIGEFIVGRDILPGDYKISTEVKLDPEYDNLGWEITINNLEKDKIREQRLTATNSDVMVTLKEGEVISISYDNTDYGSSTDDAKLIFIEN